ncbi:hypothetical protein [Alteromonas sp. OM2203]|uniref:hypothetical protein n=1 Tax=Alteromonas sp. OM2203 TaxID=3398817 RepID=UPI003AF3CD80
MTTVILLFITFPVAFAHDGNDGWVTIESFKLWSNTYQTNTIRVVVDDSVYNPAKTCSDIDSYMVASELSEESKNRLYSMLLAANLAGKPVKVFVDKSSCERNRPKIMNAVLG